LAQSRATAARLADLGHEVELLEIVTTGDRWSMAASQPPADRGMFVKELEQALLDGRADLAVHSAKDLPVALPDGLAVVAVPAREDARDVLVGVAGGLDALADGARVGTSSPRRRAQLRMMRPDLEVVELRGNVDTRLARRDAGDVDALMLAAAGLLRLGIRRPDILVLAPELCVPAPGQGLLAIEGRADDAPVRAAVEALDDPGAHASLIAERAVLAGMGGGCMTPLGALCVPSELGLWLTAFAAEDAEGAGGRHVTITRRDRDPVAAGDAVVAALRQDAA
jgi:hydroxymethylbilane synthase